MCLLLLAVGLLGAAAAPLLSVQVNDPLTGGRALTFSVGEVQPLTAPIALVFGAAAFAISLVRRVGRTAVVVALAGLSVLLGWRLAGTLTDLEGAAQHALRIHEALSGSPQEVSGPLWGAGLAGLVLVLALLACVALVRRSDNWGGTASGKYDRGSDADGRAAAGSAAAAGAGDPADGSAAGSAEGSADGGIAAPEPHDLWSDWDAISRGDDPSAK